MHNLYTNNIYETALNLIEAGVPVFPCKPWLKIPATTNGFHDATTQKDRVSKWFQHTDFNLAIPTGSVSGIIIFDDDCYKNGADKNRKQLEDKLGQLPTTFTIKTRAGGKQHYFIAPEKTSIKSSAGKYGIGIDIRGEGGYVVTAPSFVDEDKNGPAGFYEVLIESPMVELPAQWVEFLQSDKQGSSKSSDSFLDCRPDWLPERKRSPMIDAILGDTAYTPQRWDGDPLDVEFTRLLLTYIAPAEHYDDWLDILMRVHDKFGFCEECIELCDEWSARAENYDGRDSVAKKLASFSWEDSSHE
jgi:hypothetical protein